MTIFYEKNKPIHYSILDLIRDEIDKVKNKMPKIYDPIAQFLAISRPIIEVVLLNGGDITDELEHDGRGRKPISHTSLMLIHILAKMQNVGYRQIERVLNVHPLWLHALKLEKAPSHSKLSRFRTEMGERFFKNFFYGIRNLLYKLNLIEGDGVISDSAPIHASMNFARANTKPKINAEHVKEFFANIDITTALNRLYITRKGRYNPESMIRFFIFEKLGGFLSTAQALRFLKENPVIADILGFKGGQIPVQATFTNFLSKHGSVPELLTPLVEGVSDFFANSDAITDDSDIDFFFSESFGKIMRALIPTLELGIVLPKS